MDSDTDNQDGSASQSPREYDFSADLNISEVKDDGKNEPPAPAPNDPIFKSISEAVDKSLSESIKNPAAQAKPDPFREPINKLETEWPFASPETIAKHDTRRTNPVSAPTAPAAAVVSAPPQNLPGATPLGPTDDVQTATPTPPVPPAPAPVSPAIPPGVSPVVPRAVPPGISSVVPPAAPAPRPAPAAPTPIPASSGIPGQAQAVHPGGLKPLRTYEGDVAEVLASRPVSKVSMAVAESKKRGEGDTIKNAEPKAKSVFTGPTHSGIDLEEKSHIGFKVSLVVIALALIAGGAFGGYYLYRQSPLGTPAASTSPQTQAPSGTSLVPYDSRAAMGTDNASSDDLILRVRAEMKLAQAPGTIKEIVFTETKDGTKYRVTAPEMIQLSGVPVPDIIARTIQPEWMFGIYADKDGTTTPFAIVRTNLIQNAFAGMLAWEQGMPVDLKPFLGIPDNVPAPAGSFKDRIVRNKDVRAFVGSDGSTIFEYSFIDDSTLAVTANDAALSLIISRLESKAFVR